MMVCVELVGGVFDGLRFEVASEDDSLVVPHSFLYADDTLAELTGVECGEYERTGRLGDEGHPIYRFVCPWIVPLPGDNSSPV